MKNHSWAVYVRDKRELNHLTRRKLADLAGIDSSYVTLMENKGCVPGKEKILKLAKVLKCDTDEMFLVAGYAPAGIPAKKLLRKIKTVDFEGAFVDEMLIALKEVSKLSLPDQKKVAQMITAYLQVKNQVKR